MKKVVNKKRKIKSVIISKKKDLNQILSEYYVKNYGEITYDFAEDCDAYGKYQPDYFRGFKIDEDKKHIMLDESQSFLFTTKEILKKDRKNYLNCIITEYEYHLPIHKEVLKNVSLKVKNYRYLYVFLEFDSSEYPLIEINEILFIFLEKYKIYFMFDNFTFASFENMETKLLKIRMFECLLCVDMENIMQFKSELEKEFKEYFINNKVSVDILKDSIYFFDRSKFYSKIKLNKSKLTWLAHSELGFRFFDYKEAFSDLFKLAIHLKLMKESFFNGNWLESCFIGRHEQDGVFFLDYKRIEYLNSSKCNGFKLLPYSVCLEKYYIFVENFSDKSDNNKK